jgi:hypothetical protein
VVRQLQDQDLPAVIASDALAFGVSRHDVISALFAHSSSYGLFGESKLCAFALCRRFGRGDVIGLVVATNDEGAIAVVRPHVLKHDGVFLRLDTHREDGDPLSASLYRERMTLVPTEHSGVAHEPAHDRPLLAQCCHSA